MHARRSRLHLAPRHLAAGAPPPAFAMLLRKRLGGRRLHAMLVSPGERVITLDFGGERLIAELTGPHANAFLVDDQGTIVAGLRPSHSTTRALTPGAPYQPPSPAGPDVRWRGLMRFGESPGVAERIAESAEAEERDEHLTQLRERVGQSWRRELEKTRRRIAALDRDLARIGEAEALRKHADLLLAHASSLPARAAEVTVPDDFTDGSPLVITLDPALDLRANVARMYRQHKRLSAGRKQAESRRAAAVSEAAALEDNLHRLPHLDEAALVTAAPRAAAPRPVVRAPAERLPYRVFHSQSGDVIWVGRSARDNDALTFRHARGQDIWLHCADAPGSHVVIPQRGKPTGEATFLDAATLAAHHSTLRKEAQVDVVYTQVKHVRRPRGAPAGRVFTSNTKTIRVRLDSARIARLLESRDEG